MTNKPNKPAKAAKTAKRIEDRTDAPGTVSVGCRLPSGLTAAVTVDGQQVILKFKGCNDPRALALKDEQGYHGITTGVPEAHWEAFETQYAKAEYVTEGFVFAAGKYKAAVQEAQDLGERDAGFNPIDPGAPGPGLLPGDTH